MAKAHRNLEELQRRGGETQNDSPQRRHTTISDLELPEVVHARDLGEWDETERLGEPGQYPYTRGIHPNMYRGRLWTMRQFAGFGSAQQTNERFHYLLDHGQTGLSVAFHLPTLMGRDSDDAQSRGEVGKCGVAIDSLADMETLFEGIHQDEVSTSMTTNAPAAFIWAMYIAAAEKRGAKRKDLRGTIQNDILKEFIAQKTWIFPPEPSMRLTRDTIVFGTREVPQWNTISVSGYHIREAGSTAAQELAFTLYDGIEYVNCGLSGGLHVDEFAPRLSFFFNAHSDFFEEIAKYRAARRMWAHIMRDRFGAKDERSMKLRFHTQTAGCSLTAQQPYNNVVRVALQALSAVMGGTQSLHTNSLDETYALPTEEAVTIALRTQQIIAEETGVPSVVDPLGGSYFVEQLTDRIEEEAWKYINKIDDLGGMLPAIDVGYPQQEIAKAALHYQQQLDRGEKTMVGVNKYVTAEEDRKIDLLLIDAEMERAQVASLNKVRTERDNSAASAAIEHLKRSAEDESANLMSPILDCVNAYCTLGEMVGALKELWGEYTDPGYF